MLNHRRGFSMIELLVALGILSVVTVLLFNTFGYQNATYSVVDQISEVHQNSTAVTRLMERDIRNAAYGVWPAAGACGVDSTTAPDTLFISDADAILPANDLAAQDAGKYLGATPTNDPTATGSTAFTLDSTVLDHKLSSGALVEVPSYDTNADGTNDSDFQVGAGAILVDVGNRGRGVACGMVTAVNPTSKTVTVNLLTIYGSTAPQEKKVRLVPAHVYRIVTGGGAPTRLMRDNIVLAKDVEDLQVAWFYDDDQDGVMDEPGDSVGDADTAYSNSAIVGDKLREIRVNLVMSTRMNDPRNKNANSSIGQPRENRTAASSPAADGKQRRVATSTVRLRNLTL